jgi:SAM-dependent methyltransferase
MTPAVYNFAEMHLRNVAPKETLDIGALNVNGCMRAVAEQYGKYTGLDMRHGENVDVVANAHHLPFADDSFDCVLILEMLEHDTYPSLTLAEAYRVLRRGGSIIVTVPGIGFPYHAYPNDYWRVTIEGLHIWLSNFHNVIVGSNDADGPNVQGVGLK